MPDFNKILDGVKDKEIDIGKGADIISKAASKVGKNISADTIKGAAEKAAKALGDKDGKLEVSDITSVVEGLKKKK